MSSTQKKRNNRCKALQQAAFVCAIQSLGITDPANCFPELDEITSKKALTLAELDKIQKLCAATETPLDNSQIYRLITNVREKTPEHAQRFSDIMVQYFHGANSDIFLRGVKKNSH